jgi:hypothetical protein
LRALSLPVPITETGPVAERVRVREIDDDEGRRLVRIVRHDSGSVVTWRRAQMVLLSAQGMGVAGIAKVAFTSEDRVRDVIHNFNADGFSSVGSKGARNGFLDRAVGYQRPRQPVQHGAGVLRAVFRALGDEPADEALEHDVAARRLGRGLGKVACPEGRLVPGVRRGAGQQLVSQAPECVQVSLDLGDFSSHSSGAM